MLANKERAISEPTRLLATEVALGTAGPQPPASTAGAPVLDPIRLDHRPIVISGPDDQRFG